MGVAVHGRTAAGQRRPETFDFLGFTHYCAKTRKTKYMVKNKTKAKELSPKVGDGGNRKGGISWGCLTPPLLHQRSDMPCPKITSSSCFSQETSRSNSPISC